SNNQKLISLVSDKHEINVCVEIADTTEERARGLMNRESLPDNEGMLFVFDNEAHQSFWMKNTLIPLDILFFDANYNLVDYKDDFQPCRGDVCESYASRQPAMYALEVGADVLDEKNYELRLESLSFRNS
ncbi:MAG: DUF192 domain-containing protein, partial [Patescibacteria group bacterium]